GAERRSFDADAPEATTQTGRQAADDAAIQEGREGDRLLRYRGYRRPGPGGRLQHGRQDDEEQHEDVRPRGPSASAVNLAALADPASCRRMPASRRGWLDFFTQWVGRDAIVP